MLVVEGLRAAYAQGPEVLRGVRLALDADAFVAVIGPSGAGKSTLLRCINRLVEPSAGSVCLDGRELLGLGERAMRRERRRIGMVFQEFSLVERLTVMDNVLTGRLGYMGPWRSLLGRFSGEDVDRALALLGRVGLAHLLDQRADRLSGGQRQRVGIARALMQAPRLLLADEPTASLDPRTAGEIMALLAGMAREAGVPVLCNLHDVALARRYCSRVVALRDGVVAFDGPPEALDDGLLAQLYAREAHP